MSDLRINNITDRTGDSGPVIAGVCTVSSGQFIVPVGPTEYRGGRGRAIFAAGTQPGNQTINTINLVEVSTTGNATDFGDTSDIPTQPTAFGDATRACIAGGNPTPYASILTTIDYITYSSGGGASEFGNLTEGARALSNGCSDATRGLKTGGVTSTVTYSNTIDYVTIQTTGDATDFGDLKYKSYGSPHVSNGVRGIKMSGVQSPGGTAESKKMEFVNIQTKGDGQDFAEMTTKSSEGGSVCDKTRGVCAVGTSNVNTIEYITMATFGNSINFGDLTSGRASRGASNATRGIFGGGAPIVNIIDYITIQTTGDATDFGDLITPVQQLGAVSDIHGGLG